MIEGHSDNVGSADHNLDLSRHRADSVVAYLVDHHGIDRSRLAVQGYGAGRRFAYNTSAEGQQENRRVNIVIDYPNK